MELSKKILLCIGIVICLGLPISLWFLALVTLLTGDLTVFEADFYPTVIALLLLGAGGLLGIMSLMATPPGSTTPLFSGFITITLLLMGASALLLYAYLLVTPFHWNKLFAPPLVFFVYVPMTFAVYIIYSSKPMLFGGRQN